METEKEINEWIIEKYKDDFIDEDVVGWALNEAKAIGREKCISEIKEIIKDAVKEGIEYAKKEYVFMDSYEVEEKWIINDKALDIIIEKINNMK